MKKVFCILSFVCILSLFASSLYADALKIGIFDIQRVMRESKTMEGYRQKIGKEIETKRKVFTEEQNAAKQIEDKLKKETNPGERKDLEERLANELKELKRMKEDMDIELQKMDKELTQKALRDIEYIVKEIARKEDYTIIFEKGAAGIIHFKNSVDITERVIKTYDRQ